MLLAVDVGNSNTRQGLFRGNDLVAWSCHGTESLPAAEYAARLGGFLRRAGTTPADLAGISLACVVPPVAEVIGEVVAGWGKPLVEAGPGASGGLVLAYRDPVRLGPDRIAAAVGGVARAGKPCLVADLGTAVTVDAVAGDGTFLGGAILPGISLSLEALHRGTAALPAVVRVRSPASSLGRDAEEGMAAGVCLGLAAAVERLAERHRAEMGMGAPLVVTGGGAEALLPHFGLAVRHFPHLTLEGLREIFRTAGRREIQT